MSILFNTIISKPINDTYGGKKFIRFLVDNELDYHFEYRAEDIFLYCGIRSDWNSKGGNRGERVFSNWQAKRLNQRVNELFQLEWNDRCPYGYMIDYREVKEK